ncbi:hypothetical protein [Georgenia sp. AZ-5]|uniref:hypothetical protein n=1 Tax=Georgenia sp. AZ-5 TaxID=3367526 RepID=UPI0037553E71
MTDPYPTEAQLESIRGFVGTPHALVSRLREMWWPEGDYYISDELIQDHKVVEVRLATGGWSGNEQIVSELRGTFFYLIYWHMTQRGGLHAFHIPAERYDAEQDLGSLLPATRG